MSACHGFVAQRLDQRANLQFMLGVAHTENGGDRERRHARCLAFYRGPGLRLIDRRQHAQQLAVQLGQSLIARALVLYALHRIRLSVSS